MDLLKSLNISNMDLLNSLNITLPLLPSEKDLLFAWPLWKDGVLALRGSFLLTFIHALYIAYIFRKLSPATFFERENSFIKGLSILSGRTVSWLLINELIPIYTAGYLIICQDPTDLIFPTLRFFSPLTETTFDFFDAVIRAFALGGFLDAFKAMSVRHEKAYVGQVIAGVISISAGGIIWKWTSGVKGAAFKYPGWDFNVVILTTILYVFVSSNGGAVEWFQSTFKPVMFERSPQWYLLRWVEVVGVPMVGGYAKMLGVPEKLTRDDWKVVCAAVLLVGFYLRPRPVPAMKVSKKRERAGNGSGAASAPAPSSGAEM
ncbi:hypothetical protein HDV05_000104 [Chytridiales sp. JEL 0842]|nr:hypothetical protein HDV05_000104 [Chytridiales sp. JEL 0842]